jgi:hypothetical protein
VLDIAGTVGLISNELHGVLKIAGFGGISAWKLCERNLVIFFRKNSFQAGVRLNM